MVCPSHFKHGRGVSRRYQRARSRAQISGESLKFNSACQKDREKAQQIHSEQRKNVQSKQQSFGKLQKQAKIVRKLQKQRKSPKKTTKVIENRKKTSKPSDDFK
jgi:hypothetical protein